MAPSDNAPHGMDPADFLIEQRILKLEEVQVQFAAHTAAEEFRFEMISNQIRDLGEKVETGMKDLREAVLELKRQQSEQQKSVEVLVNERNEELKAREHKKARKALVWKMLWGALLALGGGLLTKFGESLWTWLSALWGK